eukprot:356044_1
MAAPMETESKQNDGQTSTINSKTDYSKLQFLAPLEEVSIPQPVSGIGCIGVCLELLDFCGTLLECFCDCLVGPDLKKYQIHQLNKEDKTTVHLFNLEEQSNCIARRCCGISRPWRLNAVIPDGNKPLFYIDKPYRFGCCCCCFGPRVCCIGRNVLDVYIGGSSIGSIQENYVCCSFVYGVHDENDKLLCVLASGDGVLFHITTAGGDETGKSISLQFSQKSPNILVEFPKIMNTIPRKVLLIAAAMMIDYKHDDDAAEDDDDEEDDDDDDYDD